MTYLSKSSGREKRNCEVPKDKKCLYCGRVSTSASLGRHLDSFIKGKDPTPPDGIHNVEEIKRTRDQITRRRARRHTEKKARNAVIDASLTSFHGNGNATDRTPIAERVLSKDVNLQARSDMEHNTTNANETNHVIELAMREFFATRDYFHETSRAWKASDCSAAIGLATPPTDSPGTAEGLGDPESSTTCREKDITEHPCATFDTWESLPNQRRSELWILELTRLVQTQQKYAEQLKEENARLISRLNQWSFDFEPASPATVSHEQRSSPLAYDSGVRGFNATNCQRELATTMSRSTTQGKTFLDYTPGSSSGAVAKKFMAETYNPLAQGLVPLPPSNSKIGPSKVEQLSMGLEYSQASEKTVDSTKDAANGYAYLEETIDQDAEAEMYDVEDAVWL